MALDHEFDVPQPLGNPPCELAECPMWNVGEQALYWTDIPNGTIWKYDPTHDTTHKVWQGDRQVGGLAFATDGRLVLCTDQGVALLDPTAGRVEPVEMWWVPLAADERFNDVTTDSVGRLLAGTLTERRTEGVLYRMEAGRRPVAMLRDLHTSNGMAFRPEERLFYHTDSRPGIITRYLYDPATGDISDPVLIYQGGDEAGSPDGLTIDREGCLWTACYRGGRVQRLSPEGRALAEIRLPTANVTSVTFGGADLRDLYITTARRQGAGPEDPGGQVFRVRVAVGGRPEWPVRL